MFSPPYAAQRAAPKCFPQSVSPVPQSHPYVFSTSFMFVIYAHEITRKAAYQSIPGGARVRVSKLPKPSSAMGAMGHGFQ